MCRMYMPITDKESVAEQQCTDFFCPVKGNLSLIVTLMMVSCHGRGWLKPLACQVSSFPKFVHLARQAHAFDEERGESVNRSVHPHF
jgi:hypothetical protein